MKRPTGSGAGSSSDPRAGGAWRILGAATLWGASATLARFLFRDHAAPPLTVVELRLLVAAALLVAWLAWRDPRALRVKRRDWGYFAVLGLFGVAAVQGTYYYSIARLGVGAAILLQYLALALIVLHEMARGRKPRPRTLAAVAAAIGGTALLVRGVDPAGIAARPLDWLIGVASAFSFAFYIGYSKRGLARYPPPTVLLYTFLVAGVFWGVVTPPWKIAGAGYGLDLWGMFLLIGTCSTLFPFALFVAGLRRMPAERAGVLATFEPGVAIVSAAIFLGESLQGIQWLGGSLVLVATLLASAHRPEEAAVTAERI